LQVVAPGEEFGRNDTVKLGCYIVKVFTGRYEKVPMNIRLNYYPSVNDGQGLIIVNRLQSVDAWSEFTSRLG